MSVPITVTDQNVANIVLSPDASATLQVRITADGPPSTSGIPQHYIAIFLESDRGIMNVAGDSQGMRIVKGLLPGVYRFRARLDNPGYIRSARQGGRDALRDGVLVTPGSNPEPVDLVVGYGTARVEGSVDTLESKPTDKTIVFLRRTGPDWTFQALTPILTQYSYMGGGPYPSAPRDGKQFVVDAMPPGEYLAFAWDNATGNFLEVPYNTEAFHQKFSSYLEHFTIRDTERVNVTLRSPLPAAALEIY